MITQNPYHKVGGRPPLTKVKMKIFELIQEEVERIKNEGLPARIFRPSDIMELYQKQSTNAPDLKTLKKYLNILCDEKKLVAKKVHDNKNQNSKRRRIKYYYEYNLEN